MAKRLLLLLAILPAFSILPAQDRAGNNLRVLQWTPPVTFTVNSSEKVQHLHFEGARYDASTGFLPYYSENLSSKLSPSTTGISVDLIRTRFEPLPDDRLVPAGLVKADIDVRVDFGTAGRKPAATLSFIPIRKAGGGYERLVSFDLKISQISTPTQAFSLRTGAAASVLASGTWYKLAVDRAGVYKADYDLLKDLGVDVDAMDPARVRMFGNGGGMLPEANALARKDDLVEIAISVNDGGDGSFDDGDYILFYGQSPDSWRLDPSDNRFHHTKHLYSEDNYYFITPDLPGTPKRIAAQPSLIPGPGDLQVSTVDYYGFHEQNLRNFIKSGRRFYGEPFDVNLVQSFTFDVPNIVASVPVYYETRVMAHSNVVSSFTIRGNGQQLCNLSIAAVGTNYLDPYGREGSCSGTYTAPGSNLSFNYTYNPPQASSVGYLDYIAFNARRTLAMAGSQMIFRDKNTIGAGVNASYTIQGWDNTLTTWDVTDHNNVFEQQVATGGNFVTGTTQLREYVVFRTQGFLVPAVQGAVVNQDLHSLPPAEYLIISHPLFLNEANRLADFRRTHDNMTVNVANVHEIYNEFSGGARDVAAIRDFIRMFYEKYPGNLPRYALLFGDGSYDNNSGSSGNTNFIPTYQSENSLEVLNSYVSDDFFGLLDSAEGDWAPSSTQYLDVAIGRMPVSTAAEARQMVDKILRYHETGSLATPTACNETNSSLGDWRNILCLVADDEDAGTHVNQTENLLVNLGDYIKKFNYDKIYIDAFKQESTPGGQLYPDAENAIDERVSNGALLINYTGHGGELGWAHEKILGVETINNWTNTYRMPLFITATCEFSRFDDPGRTSAGEYVLLNPNGGGIALYSTTRLVYSSPNAILNRDIFEHMFQPGSGNPLRVGDIFRLAKLDNAVGINPRNFTLLGDPALLLNFPRYDIVATAINQQALGGTADTIRALSKVTISGEVRHNGQKLNNFDGVIYPAVYDKAVLAKTLGQDAPASPVLTFALQKNILYKGKASVKNGSFSFTFIVPKDIAYHYGTGRLSFYAQDGLDDASGYYDSLIIGGFDPNASSDNTGPEIKLYMNNEKFVFGGTTNENPSIYALLSDSSGINTVGNGIGHDITATLDGNHTAPLVLNDYYEANLDDYQQGRILYNLKDLAEGTHALQLKVWDIFNNSSTAQTEFVVAPSAEIALAHVLNYPNPFTTHTTFFFEHNQACDGLKVQIQIYTVSGKLVNTIEDQVFCDGYRSESITWDGTDSFGDRIGRGVYVYRVKVRNSNGQTAEKFEKLVLLR